MRWLHDVQLLQLASIGPCSMIIGRFSARWYPSFSFISDVIIKLIDVDRTLNVDITTVYTTS